MTPNQIQGAVLAENQVWATILFAGDECAVCINALPQSTDFTFMGNRLITSIGIEVVFPEAVKKQVLDMLLSRPNDVFVVEMGPLGPIKEHNIKVA